MRYSSQVKPISYLKANSAGLAFFFAESQTIAIFPHQA